MFAKVIVEIGVKNVDKMFIYSIPDKYINDIKVGARVTVPFGHQILEGFVIELVDRNDDNIEAKDIIDLIDKEPILNHEMLELGNYICENTLCSKISAYQVMLPKAKSI